MVLLAALAATLIGAAPARAGAGAEVGMEDERLLLSPQEGPGAVAAWKQLGVDIVRIHARWWAIAPGRGRHTPPPGFDASDPQDPRYDWSSLDNAIGLVRAAGIRVMLTITGPGPLWTSREPSRRNPLWEPDPQDFARFAHAVARRYGTQVDRYLIWNEPNQPGWLQPQSACVRRRVCTPVAPHLYRGLVRAAVPAIRAADTGAEIVIGELAPIGQRARTIRTPIAPLPFLRTMACADAAYRPVRTGRCAGFRPAEGDAFGYHPHPRLLPPDQPNPDRDDAQLADLGRLVAVLDKLGASGRLRGAGGHLPVYLTEFGYQTSPPDHAIGVTLGQQTRYLQQAAFLSWERPRIRNLTFYQWEDEPVFYRGSGTKAYSGWQSGLNFVNGRPKPVLSTFAAPFVVERRPGRRSGLLWGQVRPAALPRLTILVRPAGGSEFHELATVQTDAAGYWSRRMVVSPGASYRFRWTPAPTDAVPDPRPRLSGIVDLARPEKTALRASAALAP